jgi:hypothetical protein
MATMVSRIGVINDARLLETELMMLTADSKDWPIAEKPLNWIPMIAS